MKRVGVIGLQGDVEEHILQTRRAAEEAGESVDVRWVRSREELEDLNGIIIPGGESTTISRLIDKFRMRDEIFRIREERGVIMGTCAGCIILAAEGDETVEIKGVRLLKMLDVKVDRNAFGRQRESFEAPVHLVLPPTGGFGGWEGDFPGVFIRAPRFIRVGEGVEVLGWLGEEPVMVKAGRVLSLTFHPELTEETLLHRYFLSLMDE
ncbi:MAG: pyridoxal 5'-phosphate synthase glutaminase subunit PdxT [Thermoplasmata archaeon]|nr:MAG: pyridoxal 5'-phosphate synthase glutaminase subunit PdxT [Thermoplasmata archaeon]